ncbi:MAG: decarboxylating NADP(+)-dependent phosphogluconate dehydrogenase [Actinomycetota bacterium]
MSLPTVAVIGMAVMGRNLALNLADRGHHTAIHNRNRAKADAVIAELTPGRRVTAYDTVAELCAGLARPRRIILMVQAGAAVDAVIDQLLPHLEPGDVVIDGGNSHHTDTRARLDRLADNGVLFVGAGISGGEEGARHGPSIMPGGAPDARSLVDELLRSIAARAESDDEPCCSWIGPGGSGHFVKMVHNGIEYGDMQVLAEAHAALNALGLSYEAQSEAFARWNHGRLRSYLIEITADILATADDDGVHLLDVILDAAGQKGTGRWTVNAAMEVARPATLVAEAVAARMVSADTDLRRAASAAFATGSSGGFGACGGPVITDLDLDDVEAAIHAAKLISYAQGFEVIDAASARWSWDLDAAAIARLWRGGCIIRARFLDDLAVALAARPDASGSVLLEPGFARELRESTPGLRRTVLAMTSAGLAAPALSSALAYFDGIRCARSTANLIQAQRDYFGAHTYERVDRPRGEFFHTDWATSATPPETAAR